jgi:DNA-binding XRE family transcriptional regulator
MAFDRETFNKVVAQSRLTKQELAKLYRTTRQTIYNWMNGGEPSNVLLLEVYNKISTGLLKAITKRLLPFDINLSKEERNKRVDVMFKTLHAHK